MRESSEHESAANGPPAVQAVPAGREPWLPWAVALIAVAIAIAAWLGSRQAAPVPEAGENPAMAALRQEIATLRQSDSISRQAMLALQDTLTQRDEQIAALRADLDFYERFVSPERQRRGLSVHAAHVRPQAAQVWRVELTLTQGREQAATSRGRAVLSVEGSRGGQLDRLDWDALRQQTDAEGLEYGLRYLQRIEGDIALPEGFAPTRLRVRLVPERGAPVEAAFNWAEIAGG